MDDADLAQRKERQLRELNRPRRGHTTGPSLFFCEDCEDPIPDARRKAMPGCRLCVECQAEMERKNV